MSDFLPNENDFQKKLETVSKKFEETRESWNTRMEDCTALTRDFENYIDVNVLINSYRHKLLAYLYGPFAKAERQFLIQKDKAIQILIINLKTKYNVKLNNERERKAIIDGHSTILTELEAEFSNQESYIEGLIKHVDKLGYALKMNTDIHMVSMGASLK